MKKDLYPFRHVGGGWYRIAFRNDWRNNDDPYPDRFLKVSFTRDEVDEILFADDFTAAVEEEK